MNKIIRLNAPHISSQSEVLRSYCDKPGTACARGDRSSRKTNLVSEMALIREKDVACVDIGVTLNASIKTDTNTVKTSEIAVENTENKTPLFFSLLATVRSLAFFTTVVVWSWTGRIEQVSQVRGKVVALGEQSQILPNHLDLLDNTVVTSARKWKPIEVVTELDGEFSPAEVEDPQQQLVSNQMRSSQVYSLMNSSRLLARTRRAIKSLKIANRATQASVVDRKSTDIIDLRRNTSS
jgi:hypothetical protein